MLTPAAEKILAEALALPVEEREALVEALSDSLDPAEASPEWACRDRAPHREHRARRGDSAGRRRAPARAASQVRRLMPRLRILEEAADMLAAAAAWSERGCAGREAHGCFAPTR
jgi:hypothetical protein